MIQLTLPYSIEKNKALKAGDRVLISGTIYTARDAAHKKICNNESKVDLNNSIIYYTGPTPEKEGHAAGSIGPTSSYRMDRFYETMIKKGQLASIGKGNRSEEVRRLCMKYSNVYFMAVGGVGALLSTYVMKKELVDFEELGCEAIYKLEVKDFPVIVAYDCYGNSIFEGEDKLN